jgi:hypothetical protein
MHVPDAIVDELPRHYQRHTVGVRHYQRHTVGVSTSISRQLCRVAWEVACYREQHP